MEQEQQTAEVTPQVSSFLTRATNVFASPGELYGEVVQTNVQTTSWLVPYICMLLLAVLTTIALFSNPTLREQVLEPGRQAMQKKVEAGKMTQEQMDQATQFTESGPLMMITGTLGAAVWTSVLFFASPLVLWLIVKYGFKSRGDYKKLLEISGLASMIGILGSIVTLLMMHLFESIHAAPGGSLLLKGSFDPHNIGHNLLGSLNVFTLWQTAIVGVGLAKISGKSNGVAMATTFGMWLLWTVATVLIGWVTG